MYTGVIEGVAIVRSIEDKIPLSLLWQGIVIQIFLEPEGLPINQQNSICRSQRAAASDVQLSSCVSTVGMENAHFASVLLRLSDDIRLRAVLKTSLETRAIRQGCILWLV